MAKRGRPRGSRTAPEKLRIRMPGSPTLEASHVHAAGEQARCPHTDFIAYVNTLPELPSTVERSKVTGEPIGSPWHRYGVLLVRCRQCSVAAVLTADEPQEDVGTIYFSYSYPAVGEKA